MNRFAHVIRHTAIATAIIALPVSLPAQPAQRRALVTAAETIVAADLMRDVGFLADDARSGRATGTPGFDAAAEYIAKTLRDLGIKPAGDSGTYFQHYTVTRAALDTVRTSASIGDQSIAYGPDILVTSFVTQGERRGKVVYVGSGIRAPALNIDPYASIDVRGKWMLVHAGNALPDGITRQQLGTAGVDYTSALDEARSRGALGIISVPNGSTGSRWDGMRSRGTSSRELTPAVGRAYAAYPLPQIQVSMATLQKLLVNGTTTAATIAVADSTHKYPPAMELEPELRVNIVASASTMRPYNVVAMIEGSDPRLRNEWISIASHLDGAVGRGATASGDSIFNAADDNASGSAGNMAIARALVKAPQSKRTILLIWDSGEEVGLWGSRHLAYGPMAERIVAHINVDMIGRTKAPGSNELGENWLSGPGEVYLEGAGLMSTVLDSVTSRVSRDFSYARFIRRTNGNVDEFLYPRTDAAPYMERGIPYIGFQTGLHGDYHRQTDDITKFDSAKMEAVARMAFLTLWTLANEPATPRMDKQLPPALRWMAPR